MTTRNSPRVLICSIRLGRGVQVPNSVTADTAMMTFVQRCQFNLRFKLRTVVICLESVRLGEFCS